MEQEPLFVEDWQTAVRAVAMKVGTERLAEAIWPNKNGNARNWLSDCLNPDRPAKLDPDELLHIARIGREHGVHTLMFYMTQHCGYSQPTPITAEDERAAAQIAVIEAAKVLRRAVEVLERK